MKKLMTLVMALALLTCAAAAGEQAAPDEQFMAGDLPEVEAPATEGQPEADAKAAADTEAPAEADEEARTAAEAEALQLTIGGMRLSREWNGAASDTHMWLIMDVSATNWHTETVSLAGALSARLTYMGRYTFDAEPAFGMDEIEPLVRLDGALAFRVPNMVSEDLGRAELSVTVEGAQRQPELTVLAAPTRWNSGTFEGGGFDSPEAAIEAYIGYFNQGDLWGMISTFAVETAVDRMDQRDYAEKLGVFQLTSAFASPVYDEYTRSLAIVSRISALAKSLSNQVCLYAWPEGYEGFSGAPVMFTSGNVGAEIDAFYNGFARSDFAHWQGRVEYVRPLTQEELVIEDANFEGQALSVAPRLQEAYGCDELADRAALVRIAGVDYVQCMQCARFGDKWYNFTLSGNLGNMMDLSAYAGGLAPTAGLLNP